MGYLKGAGKSYQQTGNVGFAKAYRDRTALSANDFLNDKRLTFFDEYGLRVLRMLGANCPEPV